VIARSFPEDSESYHLPKSVSAQMGFDAEGEVRESLTELARG
jgi:hypothetical protein